MTAVSSEYASAPLPGHVSLASWRVALLVASFTVGVPDFFNGAHNALALGLLLSILAAFLAGLALCLGSCFTAIVSVRTRLSTYPLVQRSFGIRGAMLINTVVAFSHFVAFGLNASFFSEALGVASQANGLPGNFVAFVILGSALSAGATLIGIRALEWLSLIIVPLLLGIFAIIAVVAVQAHGLAVAPVADPPVKMSFGIAVSAIVGAYMLAVATMPDLSRFICTRRGAITAMALSFPIAVPLMMTTAAIPALATGEPSVNKLIVSLGLGTPLLFVLALPMITVNALNLYSSSLALGTTLPKAPPWIFTVAGAVIGAAFALMGILGYFIDFLVFLSMIIPPIAAIYVIDSFTRFRNVDTETSIRDIPAIRWEAVAVWIGSVAIILAIPSSRFTLTTVPALDATLITAVAYLLVLRLKRLRGTPVAMATE